MISQENRYLGKRMAGSGIEIVNPGRQQLLALRCSTWLTSSYHEMGFDAGDQEIGKQDN